MICVCFVFGRYCCLWCFNSVVYTLLIVSLLLVWFSCWWWFGWGVTCLIVGLFILVWCWLFAVVVVYLVDVCF